MDLFAAYRYQPFQNTQNVSYLNPRLTQEKVSRQIYLVESSEKLFGGFDVFKRISFSMPMLYPFIFLFYFPGMGLLGPCLYRFVAKIRNHLPVHS